MTDKENELVDGNGASVETIEITESNESNEPNLGRDIRAFNNLINKHADKHVRGHVLSILGYPEIEDVLFYRITHKNEVEKILVISKDSCFRDKDGRTFLGSTRYIVENITYDEVMNEENVEDFLFIFNGSNVVLKDPFRFGEVTIISGSTITADYLTDSLIIDSNVEAYLDFGNLYSDVKPRTKCEIESSRIISTSIRSTNNTLIEDCIIRESDVFIFNNNPCDLVFNSRTEIYKLYLSTTVFKTEVSVRGDHSDLNLVNYSIKNSKENGLGDTLTISLENILAPSTYVLGVYTLNIFTVIKGRDGVVGVYFNIRDDNDKHLGFYLNFDNLEEGKNDFQDALIAYLGFDETLSIEDEFYSELMRVCLYRVKTLRNYISFLKLNRKESEGM